MESSSSWIGSLLINLLTQLPIYALYLCGIVIAILRWRKHPKVSAFTSVAFGLLLFWSVIANILQTILPHYLYGRDYSVASIGYVFSAIAVVSTIIHAISLILLLLAIFGQRSDPAEKLKY